MARRFSGPTKQDVDNDILRAKSLIQEYNPSKYVFASDQKQVAELWSARKEALWTVTSIKPPGYALWSTDVAVPVSRLAEIIGKGPAAFET